MQTQAIEGIFYSAGSNWAIQPWFHGFVDRTAQSGRLQATGKGAFLVRMSSTDCCVTVQYINHQGQERNVRWFNHGERGYSPSAEPPASRGFPSIAAFVAANHNMWTTHVPSPLTSESLRFCQHLLAQAAQSVSPYAAADEVAGMGLVTQPALANPATDPMVSASHTSSRPSSEVLYMQSISLSPSAVPGDRSHASERPNMVDRSGQTLDRTVSQAPPRDTGATLLRPGGFVGRAMSEDPSAVGGFSGLGSPVSSTVSAAQSYESQDAVSMPSPSHRGGGAPAGYALVDETLIVSNMAYSSTDPQDFAPSAITQDASAATAPATPVTTIYDFPPARTPMGMVALPKEESEDCIPAGYGGTFGGAQPAPSPHREEAKSLMDRGRQDMCSENWADAKEAFAAVLRLFTPPPSNGMSRSCAHSCPCADLIA